MATIIARQFGILQKHAESIRNDATHDLRGGMEIGDAWAQGDLLIRRIAAVPPDAQACPAEAQLVPGITQGARHCLAELEGITMYRLAKATPLQGPIFTVADEVTVEHPEHGHVILGAGVYAIEYQRAFADELRRRND